MDHAMRSRLPAVGMTVLPARLGQEAMTPGEVKRHVAVTGLLATALGSATAWIGVRAGLKESGFVSAAGWIVGVAGGLVGAVSLLGTASVLLVSEERLRETIREVEREEYERLRRRFETQEV